MHTKRIRNAAGKRSLKKNTFWYLVSIRIQIRRTRKECFGFQVNV